MSGPISTNKAMTVCVYERDGEQGPLGTCVLMTDMILLYWPQGKRKQDRLQLCLFFMSG